MGKEEKFFINSTCDGLRLGVTEVNTDSVPKGIVQISHGMSENRNRYIDFMRYLSNRGYISIIHDHRGHGESVKNKNDLGYFYDHGSYFIVKDLFQINSYIKEKHKGLPVTLLGHSMGSLVARCFLKNYSQSIDKLVLCGPPTENKMVDMGIMLCKLLGKFYSSHHRSKFLNKLVFKNYDKGFYNENDWLCSDPEVVKRYSEDDMCGFIFTLNGFMTLFSLIKEVYSKNGWSNINKSLPILYIAGSDDPVIQSKKHFEEAQRFLSDIGYKKISQKLYKDKRHELLNEKGKEKIYDDIINWIETY